MKIAYFSPFNPIKSGISDFSEELVMKLKEYIDIDIFVDGYKPSNKNIIDNFTIYDIDEIYNEEIRSRYDFLVYHIGNNAEAHSNIVRVSKEFPGICELHDISLHNFVAEETLLNNNIKDYIRIMKYCHGNKGEKRANQYIAGSTLPPWENESLEFTVNKHIIDKATAIIVHSDMAKQMIKGINYSIPIINIPLHTIDIVEDSDAYKKACREQLGIDQNSLIFASFGFASKNKRIIQILEALSIYKEKSKNAFQYYIVGKVQAIDLRAKIKELNLEDNVKITGYTKLDEFRYYMGACDIALNLRYPTQGETSASLHRLLGMGKPVIVSNIGTFEEYPDEIVLKVRYDNNEVNDIYYAICELTSDKIQMKKRENEACEYAKKKYDLVKNALLYLEFFKQIKSGNFQEDILDDLIDTLIELDLTDDNYIKHLFQEKIIDSVLQ